MAGKILLVDDEENVLAAYTRSLRRRFEIDTALGGEEALAALASRGPFAVLVSDMRMPGMDGVTLLGKVKERYPGIIRVMLTGNADQATAIEAVNRGSIFRFLTKPCDNETLSTVLQSALEQHRLVNAEKELLERTVKGAILMLGELLSIIDPGSFGRSQQVGTLASHLAQEMGLADDWMLDVAAVLSQIGVHTLPPTVVAKLKTGGFLGAVEREMVYRVPEIGANLIKCIPRLDEVASIVYYAQKNYNGTGFPADDIKGDMIPEGARVLRAATDYVSLLPTKPSPDRCWQDMASRTAWYDPRVLKALKELLDREQGEEGLPPPTPMALEELQAGYILAEDVMTLENTWMVLPAGTVLGRTHLEKLRNFARLAGLKEPLMVRNA